MMKSFMKRMMPMMNGTIENMSFQEKEEMMVRMMPRMMSNLSFEEKMRLMSKMMPMMMADVEQGEMEEMMDTMMPMMMDTMKEKGVEVVEMMQLMCPKCLSVVSSGASEEEKTKLKEEMQKNLDLL